MNADYPANPAAPGSHPFPGVTQAVPQGAGGPESPTPVAGAPGSRTHSQSGAGGGSTHSGAPSVPAPRPYASPAGTTGAASPASTPPSAAEESAPHSTTRHATTTPSTTHSTTPSTTHSTTPSTTHSTTQPGTAPVAPVRRASLRTGTQPVSTDSGAKSGDAPESKRFGFFGKKADAKEPSGTTETLRRKGGPRKVRAMMTAIDPWSAMKMSFLTSIAAGIALVVAVSVVWGVLNQMGVFVSIQDQVTTLFDLKSETAILAYFAYSKIMSGTILVAVFNAVIVTALGTIGALIYNVIAKLVGGVYVTLTDD